MLVEWKFLDQLDLYLMRHQKNIPLLPVTSLENKWLVGRQNFYFH